MQDPEISVLMTVFNAAETVAEAIQSILEQSFPQFEFIIVDDGSTDSTASIVSGFMDPRIHFIRRAGNRGQTASLNEGLRICKAPLVARQDADDVAHFRRLEFQHNEFCNDERLVLLGTEGVVCDKRGMVTGLLSMPLTQADVEAWFLIDNPIIHASAMFHTAVVRDQLQGYNEAFEICQDYDLWSRVVGLGSIRNLGKRLVAYRMHEASLSHGSNQKTVTEATIVRERMQSAAQLKPPARSRRVSALNTMRRPGSIGITGLLGILVGAPSLFCRTTTGLLRLRGKDVETWRKGPVVGL
jgi:glycosyltransferase involved in cell wall biosynthesis